MIDVKNIRYGLTIYTPEGDQIQLDQAQRGVSLSDAKGELAQKLQVEFTNRKIGDLWLHQYLALAGMVYFAANWGMGWKTIFQGKIYKHNIINAMSNSVSMVVYDNLFPVQKSQDNRVYPAGTTGRKIITDISNEWGIPLGRIDGPDVGLAKQVYKGDTLADMMLTALKESKKKGSGKFYLRSVDGYIQCVKLGPNTDIYQITEDNGASVEVENSIEDIVTRVKTYGQEDADDHQPVEAVLDGKTEFGIIQKIVNSRKNDSEGIAKQTAQEILDESGKPSHSWRIKAPDIPFLRKGDLINIIAGTLNGDYVVEGVEHDPDTRTMTLEVDDP